LPRANKPSEWYGMENESIGDERTDVSDEQSCRKETKQVCLLGVTNGRKQNHDDKT